MPKVNARRKGHNYERKIRKELIGLGWESCQTSRYSNRALDDAKVDLCYTDPFFFQVKAVESGINYHKLLTQMPKGPNHNVIIHKRNRTEVVVLLKSSFYKIINPTNEK